jgi:hypothetical protein
MPDIQAFRGIRYDLGHVGSLSNVVAPPYDVIDADLQRALYEKHPANVVRLILNRDELGDDDRNNRYTRAARLMRSWQREGVLFTESDPAIYVYHQVFHDGGDAFTRRGFMCRVRLERFGEGAIYPHEETHGGPKADRLNLWRACRANLSPIFGLYPDPTNLAQDILERAIERVAPLEATDHLGVVHRLWPVTDLRAITEVTGAMGGRPVYIADGHHRYETALALRDELLAGFLASLGGEGRGRGEHSLRPSPPIDPPHQGEGAKPEEGVLRIHPANFVLMTCVSMSDPGMIVLPTHRLFRGLPPIKSGKLIEKLGGSFDTQVIGQSPGDAAKVWAEIESEGDQGCMAFYTAADQKWVRANINDVGRRRMREVADEHSSDWQSLGVSILHRLIIDTLLANGSRHAPRAAAEAATVQTTTDGTRSVPATFPAPKYVRGIDEFVRSLQEGDTAGRDATGQSGTGGRFELAALVMPATVEHIRTISNHGERMPAKSTYFYPKLLSGLVINPLE